MISFVIWSTKDLKDIQQPKNAFDLIYPACWSPGDRWDFEKGESACSESLDEWIEVCGVVQARKIAWEIAG